MLLSVATVRRRTQTTQAHKHVNSRLFELHAVSQGTGDKSSFVKTAKDVWPWFDYIHIREKHLTEEQKMEWAYSLQHAGIPSERIVINGLNELDKHQFIQGVHWSQYNLASADSKPINTTNRLRLGVSVHSLNEAREAEDRGADYLFYGHVFSSGSKPKIRPRGLPALTEVCSAVTIPVIAIGGIKPGNIADVCAAGARGAAVLSSLWTSDNPKSSGDALRQAVESLGTRLN